VTLSAGSRLGPYEIVSPLGAGGMGEVYKARDTKLDREVAIKVLPEKLAADSDSLARFEREAKAVAALSHPNILGIYDLGRDGGVAYAAMELLRGETLRERLEEGALPQRKALEYGLQVAHGLAAAHEKGIVHRDLKPENVFVTPEGRLKILDFGLAKVSAVQSDETRSPTVAATEPGTVMGTVGYMSPEQVRGRPADHRSDIFSLGAILYEMLSGERAFRGESAAETMAAIAQKDPPQLAETARRFPPSIERILRHCLEKRPEERFDTAHDLAFALETAMGAPSATSQVVPAIASKRRSLMPVLGVLALLAALGAGFLAGGRMRAPTAPSFRQITYHRGYIQSARFAPDGQTVVYGSTRRDEPLRVYSTRLDSIESRSLDLPPADVVGMSRNGQMAVLLNRRHTGYWISVGTLARSDLAGGAPQEILENVNDADISPDGTQFAVVREMGTRQRLEFPIGRKILETTGWISHPRISPDGKRLAFLDHPAYGNDMGHVALADAGGKVTRITDEWNGTQGLAWGPGGKEIWFTATSTGTASGGRGLQYTLWAVRPGKKTRSLYAPPIDLVVEDVSENGKVLLNAIVSRSEIGGLLAGDTRDRDLSTWSDEAAGGISDDGGVFTGVEQSAAGVGIDPFVYYRRARETASVRIGSGTANGISADGKWVITASNLPEKKNELTFLPTGAGQARVVSIGRVEHAFSAQRRAFLSADGRRLLFPGNEPGRLPRLWLIDLEHTSSPRTVSPEGVTKGVLSPDGQTVAVADDVGQFRLCPASGGACSPVKGVQPEDTPEQWEGSGKAILVWNRNRTWPAQIYRVDLGTGERRLWKEINPSDPAGVLYGNIQLARDGQHYIYRVRRVTGQLFLGEDLK
jgi:dipeptidyl aminopeptidase/acylaminoacyl peptidase/tRNA A-37 threonylcarbamoyl transferase component Bud32